MYVMAYLSSLLLVISRRRHVGRCGAPSRNLAADLAQLARSCGRPASKVSNRRGRERPELSLRGMDRIWQWAWTRYAPRYSWAMCAISVPLALQNYLLFAVVVVAFE